MDEAIVFWTAFAAVAAAAAVVLSLVTYFQNRERTILWVADTSLVRERDRKLVNTSRGLVAEIIQMDDNFVGPNGEVERMIYFSPTLPAVVEPQNWAPVAAHQILGAEPIAITLRWHQKRLSQKTFGKRVYSATIYL